MKKNTLLQVSLLLLLCLVAWTGEAMACPSCYGAADAPMTEGMNMAIISLLAVTGSVLFGFASLFVQLRKRTRMLLRNSTEL